MSSGSSDDGGGGGGGGSVVPHGAWHLDMMNDVSRNTCYDTAIRAAVRGMVEEHDHRAAEGDGADVDADAHAAAADANAPLVVLDIGMGAGMLSLMAARAVRELRQQSPAAARVSIVGVEVVPELAALASRIAKAHGFGETFY